MAQIIKQITVDVAKKNLFQAIVAKQNDSNSRFLQVAFVNEGEPIVVENSSSVIINAERADNASKSFAGTVNEDGTVTVPLTNWMLELDDFVRCDVSIIDSESRKLTSTSFTIEVEAAANSGEDISDDENYDILVTLLGDVADAKRDCDTATANANTAAEFATNSSNLADEATMAAIASKEACDIATGNANTAATDASEAASSASTAKNEAAAAAATEAASSAIQAANGVENAIERCNEAEGTATAAAAAANTAKSNADTATASANAAAEAARAAATAVGEEIDGIVVRDTTNSVDYIAKFRLIDGKPAIEYIQI